MVFPVDGRVGQIFATAESSARAALRERVAADQGDVIYGVAQGDITAAGRWVTIRQDGTVRAMTGTNVAAGEQVAVSLGTVTSANYGWFHANGKVHGMVNQTVQASNAATALFIAADANPGQAVYQTVGAAISTSGSQANVFLMGLAFSAVTASTAATSTSVIFGSAGDIYGQNFRLV